MDDSGWDNRLKQLVLRVRAYGSYRGRLLETIRAEVSSRITELDARLTKLGTDRKGHIVMTVEGDDEEFVANVLVKEYGEVPKIEDLVPQGIQSGYFIDVGRVGYGLYVNIGVTVPKRTDALIPLHRIRKQVGMQGKPLRAIAGALVLVDDLPVGIKLTEVDVKNGAIEAELSEAFLERIDTWKKDDHERLLVLGINRRMLDNILRKSGHTSDIYQIEQLGRFEYSLRCKRSTRASGILAAIGPKMRGVPMHLFIPQEVRGKQHAQA